MLKTRTKHGSDAEIYSRHELIYIIIKRNKEKMNHFVRKFVLFSVILIVISTILYLTLLKSFYVKSFPLQVLLIGSLTLFSHLRLIKACEQNIRRFTTVYMLSVTLKLMTYLSFLLISLLIDHSNTLVFVLTFFALYTSFTVFEVIQVLKFLKK